jgi:hypothetical protein
MSFGPPSHSQQGVRAGSACSFIRNPDGTLFALPSERENSLFHLRRDVRYVPYILGT